jgi:hypothetical protein
MSDASGFWKLEDESILQKCFRVQHASAACLDATKDPCPGPDVSKYQGQTDCGLPEREQAIGSDLPGCMDSGEPFVVSKGHLLTQTL